MESVSLTIRYPHLRSVQTLNRQATEDNLTRIRLYGPMPSNPFKSMRQREKFTLVALAAASNMDKKAIARLEQGMYSNPLPSAVRYWVEVRHLISEGDLWNEYEDFQHNQRARHKNFFGSSLQVDVGSTTHPFRQLRGRRPSLQDNELIIPVGITDTCAGLCLPLDTIQFWEKKWRNQQSVPKTVKAVLNEIGYSRTMIASFEDSYKAWRLMHKQVSMV